MAELIFIPADRFIQNHIHMYDSSGHTINCMSPQMPSQVDTQLSVLSEIQKFYSEFGETLHPTPMIYSLRSSFWSLEELRDWVRENCSRDVYARRHEQAMCFEFFSPSKEETDLLNIRLAKPKNFLVKCEIHKDRKTEIEQWVTENCQGRSEYFHSSPDRDNRQGLTYYFKEETDETMFRVRWDGCADVKISRVF